jgi:HAD superfamily hydrolase (TIGR01549 family)
MKTLPAECVADWQRGDDHALLWYRPSRPSDRDPASHLILRFKDRYADAITAIAGYAIDWVRRHERSLRDEQGIRFVMVVPRSAAGLPNVACERLASELALEFPWLTHLPSALIRTVAVPPAHLGGARSKEAHLQTMRYEGPTLGDRGRISGLRCEACEAEFIDQEWLRRHLSGARHQQATADTRDPGVLLLDDVFTSGATSSAAREILQRDADAGPVIGLFAGRTRRDDAGPDLFGGSRTADTPAASSRNGWGILLDLDGTLVDSSAISDLRENRAWKEASAAFVSTSVRGRVHDMLEALRPLGRLGVVTSGPRPYAESLLRHHGLAIPVLVAYHDVQHHKPHPEPLLKAAALLQVRADHTIYIGDDPDDLAAAAAAGAHGIGYGGGFDSSGSAVARAADWGEVVAAVRRIVRG